MRKVLSFLAAIVLLGALASQAFAAFSVVAPSGQTIYYNYNNSTQTITITYPGSGGWDGYTMPTGALVIPDSINYYGVKYPVTLIGAYAFYDCSGLTSVTIPNSVTSIIYDAFRYCTGLTSVTIGNSVTSIGDNAFYGCNSLTSVTIPNSVTSIGYRSFYDCSGLTSVTIGSGVTLIDGYAFYNCSSLTSVTIPNSVTTIGYYAFQNCTSLTSVTIPNSVTSIGGSAFQNCTGLTSVTIPNSVTSLWGAAFQNCSGLTSVTIGSGVTIIGTDAFRNCSGLTSVIFNADSCNAAGGSDYSVFYGCSNLTNITFGNNVRHIPGYLCYGCSSMTSVTIGSGVTSIGIYAFEYCTGLTSVTIPNSVGSIGNGAFRNCISLDTVYMMPPTPPSLGSNGFSNNASGRVFIIAGCGYDNYYTTVSSNPWYTYRNDLRRPTININVTVQSSNTALGSADVVLGLGNTIVRCDSTVVVQAAASYGYHFDHWSNGSTANPDTIALVGDTTITAYFAVNSYTITGTSADSARGTVTGSDTVFYLDTVTLTAIANEHYYFDHWSDYNTSNPRQVIVTGDITLMAYFTPDQYQLTVNSNDTAQGTVSGGGTVYYLDTVTLTAIANEHYHFDHWSDSNTSNPRQVIVTGDITLMAYFNPNQYQLTVYSNDTAQGTVSGGGTYDYNTSHTITATPNSGYRFVRWDDNNTEATRTIMVTSDMSFTAYFESDGTQGIDDVDDRTEEVTVYASNGSIVVGTQSTMPADVLVYDITGRRIANATLAAGSEQKLPVPSTGVYLVKVGNLPTRKVVVIK